MYVYLIILFASSRRSGMKLLNISSLGNFTEVQLRDCIGTSGKAYHWRGCFWEETKASNAFLPAFTCFWVFADTKCEYLFCNRGSATYASNAFSCAFTCFFGIADSKHDFLCYNRGNVTCASNAFFTFFDNTYTCISISFHRWWLNQSVKMKWCLMAQQKGYYMHIWLFTSLLLLLT